MKVENVLTVVTGGSRVSGSGAVAGERVPGLRAAAPVFTRVGEAPGEGDTAGGHSAGKTTHLQHLGKEEGIQKKPKEQIHLCFPSTSAELWGGGVLGFLPAYTSHQSITAATHQSRFRVFN